MWSILEDGRPLLPMSVARLLPSEVAEALEICEDAVDEICLRADRQAFAVSGGRNVALDAVLTGEALSEIFLAACGGSLYAHAETVKEGYLTLPDGVRIGVIGHAVVDDGRMVGVRDISSLCFRIPGTVTVDVAPLIDTLRGFSEPRGLLLFSPPGGGKTTVLRSLIRALASGESPRRVAVVDTRRELGACLGSSHLCVDVLSGYPRRQGIEIAARCMDA
ncbi:MAG: hypothetical protein IKT43_02015, partial [Clostridia bacterium]|nr:hypothetical protein [Clostridia bacterium]